MNNNETTTDHLYEFLADPSKLRPIKQTAKIVHNNHNDSDNEESFLVDYNNNINKKSPKINFNSDQNSSDMKKKSNNNQEERMLLSDSDDSTTKKHIQNKNKESKESNDSIKLKESNENISTKNKTNNSSVSSDNNLFKQNINESNLGKYKSRLSSRDRSSSGRLNNLKNTMYNNIKVSMDDFSSSDKTKVIKPPTVKPINIQNPNVPQTEQRYTVPDIATQKELKFKKMETFAKLMHIKSLGIEFTKKYNMDSDLDEMEAEVKYHSDIQSKKNGVQLAKSFMCNAITGLEFFNERYDPFGFKLKGWSDQVKMNKDDFEEVFADLLEKYKGNGSKMEPEMKLAMMLIISAGSFHMSQTIATGLPGIDDVIKNNPQLLSKIQSGINKSISGPTEFEKKKQIYDNVKKMHEQKLKTQSNQENKPKENNPPENKLKENKPRENKSQENKSQENKSQGNKPQENKPQENKSQENKSKMNKPIQTVHNQINKVSLVPTQKPTSVKNLLQDIKKSVPFDSIVDSYSITEGNTIDTETDSSNRPSISQGVKTKSRLMTNKKVQLIHNS